MKQVKRYPKNKSHVTKLSYPLNLFIKVGGRWKPPIKVEDGIHLKSEIEGAKVLYGGISDFKTEKIVK